MAMNRRISSYVLMILGGAAALAVVGGALIPRAGPLLVLQAMLALSAGPVCLLHPELAMGLYTTTGVWKTAPIFQDPLSPYPTLVVIALVVVGALIHASGSESGWTDSVRVPSAAIWLGLFCAYITVSALTLSVEPAQGLEKALRFSLFTLPIWSAFLILGGDWERLLRMHYCILILSALVSVLSLASVPGFAGSGAFQGATLFDEVRIMTGRTAGLGVVLSAVLLLHPSDERVWRPALVTLGGIGLAALMLSAAKGPVVALSVTVVLLVYVDRKQVRLSGLGLALLVGGLLLLTVVTLTGGAINLHRFRPSYALADPATRERLTAVKASVSYVKASPVLGIGSADYQHAGRFGTITYPHNVILEVGAEYGLVGLTLFFGALAGVIKSAGALLASERLNAIQRRVVMLTVAGFVFMLVNAQVSGDIQVNRYVWFFGGILVALRASLPEAETAGRENP